MEPWLRRCASSGDSYASFVLYSFVLVRQISPTAAADAATVGPSIHPSE